MMPPLGQPTVRRKEAAKFLGVCDATLRKLERDPAMNFPKRVMVTHSMTGFDAADLVAFRNSRKVTAPPKRSKVIA